MIVNQQDSPMFRYLQDSFKGGMNLFDELHDIADNEYGLATNIRNRNGGVEIIRKPLLLDKAPPGKKQGLYGFDNYLVAFIAGRAYYKLSETDSWIRIEGFLMSHTAERIYAQVVPASTINFNRKLVAATDVSGNGTESGVNVALIVEGTVAGLVCQDGVTQPIIILPDGTCRSTQTYADWTTTLREYVPIGKQMAFLNGILFVLSPDGKQILRSVSGRPLDFVVNITTTGAKGGDAYTTSYAVSYDTSTCLVALNTGQLLVGTDKISYVVSLDYQRLIFGEPTFNNIPVSVGVVNQFSVVEMLDPNNNNSGDYIIVDTNGIRSLNAVKATRNEGEQSIFTSKISSLFKHIKQLDEFVSAAIFDNYAFISVKTIYGFNVLVYDLALNCWVGLDTVTGVGVKQFAAISLSDEEKKIYVITSDDEIYQLFAEESDLHMGYFTTKAITTGSTMEHKIDSFRPVYQKAVNTTEKRITIQHYTDDKLIKRYQMDLFLENRGLEYIVYYPAYFSSTKAISNMRFNILETSQVGWRSHGVLAWQNAAKLVKLEISAVKQTNETSINQQTEAYA